MLEDDNEDFDPDASDDEDADGFSYDEYIEREFGDSSLAAGSSNWVRWTVIVVLIAMILPLMMAILS